MKPLLIIKTGGKLASMAAIAGDFEDWILAGSGWPPDNALTAAVHQAAPLPEHDRISGVIITGSPAMITDRSPWIDATAAWLRTCRGLRIPVLGICFGHQLLAHAFGGEVGDNPGGVEVGTVEVELTDGAGADFLLGTMPKRFPAQASHRQSVLTLPPEALHLASSARDPNQGYVIDEHLWGVQFHPEFSAEVSGGYVEHYRDVLTEQGEDADALLAACRPTPEAAGLLPRFAEEVRKGQM